jgi:hypothetical protein
MVRPRSPRRLLVSRELPLLLASVLAIAIVGVCGFELATAFLSSASPSLRPQAAVASSGEPRLLPAEKEACDRIARAQIFGSLGTTTRDRFLYQQNQVTEAQAASVASGRLSPTSPALRGILPPMPSLRQLAPWRYVFFFAFFDIGTVNLDTKTASVEVAVEGGTPGQAVPARVNFPTGTSLELDILSSTSGAISLPLTTGAQLKGISRGSFTLPLAGSSTNYPDDVYAVRLDDIAVRVQVPNLPQVRYDVDVGDANRAASVGESTTIDGVPGVLVRYPNGHECAAPFVFVFHRVGRRAFIWLMALIPLVFVFLVLHAMSAAIQESRRKQQRRDARVATRGFEATAGVETGMAFLSILPLRAVLVPSSVAAPTRIDYVLGLELGVLVLCLVVGRLWIARLHKSPRPE